MECGECHYCITAQEHKKKYKNGAEQIFGYYSCTKKGEIKCSQPYVATTKLEHQPRFVFMKIKEGVKKTNDESRPF